MSKLHTRNLIGSILGVENEDGEAVLDGEIVSVDATSIETEVLTTEGTEGEAVVALVEEENEIEEVAVEVETMSENVEALEALAADLKVSIADGGLSPQAAVFFAHAQKAIAGRHFDMSRRTVAVESFGSASSRLQMTKDAHEGIIDTIKSFIQGIIAFVKKMVKKVVDWFKNLLDGKKRLKKRVEVLEKAVANMGSELKDRSQKLSLAEGLTLGGRAPTGSVLATAFSDMGKAIAAAAKLQEDMATTCKDATAEATKNLVATSGEADLDGVVASIRSEFSAAPGGGSGFDTGALTQNQNGGVVGTEFPGSKVLIKVAPKRTETNDLSLSSFIGLYGFRFVDSKKNLKMDTKLEIKPLASGECLTLLNGILAFLDGKDDGGDGYKSLSDDVETNLDKLRELADKLETGDSDKGAVLRGFATGLQTMMSGASSQIVKVQSYTLKRCQQGANLVAASVSAYK